MSQRIGFVMDPLAGINPKMDTTLALMLAAQKTGADLFYMGIEDLYVEGGRAFTIARRVRVQDDPGHWFDAEPPESFALATLDAVMMRKDPPVDKRFLHACAILEQAVRDGVRVVNNPTALITLNEKLFATHFPDLCPPTLVTGNKDILHDFLYKHGTIIIKPLDSMGGDGVFMVTRDDVNFEVIWEMHTQRGTYPVVAQKFIPAITDGDKRVIVINGEPFGHVLVRTPKSGSIRGNMAAGGTTHVRAITPREHEIATQVGKELVRHDIVFCGLDIIGDHLIEINITSPTGIRQISSACDVDIAALVIQAML